MSEISYPDTIHENIDHILTGFYSRDEEERENTIRRFYREDASYQTPLVYAGNIEDILGCTEIFVFFDFLMPLVYRVSILGDEVVGMSYA